MTSSRDPLQGLIDYVNEVKPFHTKIAEIRIQYEHNDLVNVNITETVTMRIDMVYNDELSANVTDTFYFQPQEIILYDKLNVIVSDRTSNMGWDVAEWDLPAWDYPVEPFMYITQNIIEAVNVTATEQVLWPLNGPAPQQSGINSGTSEQLSVGITDQVEFIGAAHPTLRLHDTVGVAVTETAGSTVGTSSGSFVGSWDYPMWDIGGFDEDLNVLINIYGNPF